MASAKRRAPRSKKAAPKKQNKAAPSNKAKAKAKAKAKTKTKAKAKTTTKAKAKAKATAKATAKVARPRAPRASRPAGAAPSVLADWRVTLRAEVGATGGSFADYLRGLEAIGWEHADTPELAGLERWGIELTKRDRRVGIGALVRVAQHGFPIAAAAGGIGLDGMGFHASEGSMDGAPVEKQIQLAAAWLDAPDAAHLAAVAEGNDPSRQLQVWDDDLRPGDDSAHWWYLDVGQCCGHAITQRTGDPRKDSYYDWDPAACVGRGLVLAVRGLRSKGASIDAILERVRAALVA